ncbi:MAG: RagB/SusD family nutrient uptake outer membrane protein [Bacteroidota bacterium]|nr:RagB/SusD family nutrient uptake outer membrane protein [Bacteroidota bacterium]
MIFRHYYSKFLLNLLKIFSASEKETQHLLQLNVAAYSRGRPANPLFFPLNSSGETRVAQPSFVTNAEAGDTRLNKVSLRTTAESQDGLQSSYDFYLYKTDADRIPIIRNEELILLYAEVKAKLGPVTDAVIAINRIRNAEGLPVYIGAVDMNSLITEILKQRRYSLYGEGHRWIDLRRNGLLAQLPIDRPGDDVWLQFPIPANE